MNPFDGWPNGAPEAACGLVYTVVAVAVRQAKRRPPNFATVIALFLSGVMIPAAVAFLLQPFQDPKPDLSQHGVWYFPVAGGAILYALYVGFTGGEDPRGKNRYD